LRFCGQRNFGGWRILRQGGIMRVFATGQQRGGKQQREKICPFHVASLPEKETIFNAVAAVCDRRKMAALTERRYRFRFISPATGAPFNE